jgi:hypothetical protein
MAARKESDMSCNAGGRANERTQTVLQASERSGDA